jgi:hypothetical protein
MKRLILAAGGLLLATANTPPTDYEGAAPEGELSSVVAAEAPAQSTATPAKAAKPAKTPRIAAAEPAASAYPRCSATVRDRCVQGRPGHARATQARRIQLAMRAGERG